MNKLPREQRFLGAFLLATVGGGALLAASLPFLQGLGPGTEVRSAPIRDPGIPLRVDPAVELFSVIHRLAGTGQYDEVQLPEYVQDAWDHFGTYQDHPAVDLARAMSREDHINGNAPMDLAVHLTPPPELALRAPLELVLADMDSRWNADLIPPLLEAARTFALDTDFQAFFRSHQPFYHQAVANLRSTLEGANMLPWLQAFFGAAPDRYVVVLGLLNGTCNYGSRITFPDGTQEFVSLLGGRDPDDDGVPRYHRGQYVPTVVHEFSHSHVNPLVDRNRDTLIEAGEALFAHLEEDLHRWGYDYWYVMLYEYLVRATTIRYLDAEEGTGAARAEAARDEAAGFPGTGKLADLLAEYQAHRDTYPDLQPFIPQLAAFFQALADSFE